VESFGRYQLLTKLASGGMAEIYLARQQGLEGFEKLLVIKRILPHLAEDEEFIQMFLDEARIAARLNHPNIVQIFDLGAIGDSFFIAMEYIHGEDVRRVWKQADAAGKPLPIALTCRIVAEAASALDYAHKRIDPANAKPLGIIHRDVSPQNILVSFEGGVKLVDFGIAKAADSVGHTRSGVLKGKYSYMSPEQAAGKKIDKRTDIFALGVVLYELLTGIRLFKRNTEVETLKAVAECQVEPPSVLNPDVSAELERIVMKALERKVEDRYREALEFQIAIEEWLTQHRLPASSAHLTSFMRDVYWERLSEEARIGRPLWEVISNSDSGLEPVPVKTGITQETSKERHRPPESRRAPQTPPPPPVPPDDDGEPTEGAPSFLSESRPTDSATNSFMRQPRLMPLVVGSIVALTVAGVLAGLVARQMVRRNQPPTLLVPRAAVGEVSVSTVPAGARIALDDRARDELTPMRLPEIPFGEHRIRVQKDGYEDREVGFNVDSDHKQLQLELVAVKAANPIIASTSTPRPSSGRVGERNPGEKNADRTGLVEITSEPRANVLLNGKDKGSTPFRERLAPGKYAFVVVNHDIGLEQTVPVVVRAGGDVKENVAPKIVPVRIVAEPWADVYLGGRKLGQTPMGKVSLVEGEHTLVFRNDDLKVTKTVKVDIKAGSSAVVKVKMTE
jgi:eukaryotic-like serine/threonine-protein kinase